MVPAIICACNKCLCCQGNPTPHLPIWEVVTHVKNNLSVTTCVNRVVPRMAFALQSRDFFSEVV